MCASQVCGSFSQGEAFDSASAKFDSARLLVNGGSDTDPFAVAFAAASGRAAEPQAR